MRPRRVEALGLRPGHLANPISPGKIFSTVVLKSTPVTLRLGVHGVYDWPGDYEASEKKTRRQVLLDLSDSHISRLTTDA